MLQCTYKQHKQISMLDQKYLSPTLLTNSVINVGSVTAAKGPSINYVVLVGGEWGGVAPNTFYYIDKRDNKGRMRGSKIVDFETT